jgi:hypothetical protein
MDQVVMKVTGVDGKIAAGDRNITRLASSAQIVAAMVGFF